MCEDYSAETCARQFPLKLMVRGKGEGRPPFSLGTRGQCPQVISILAGAFEEIICIFVLLRGLSLICHFSEDIIQSFIIFDYQFIVISFKFDEICLN